MQSSGIPTFKNLRNDFLPLRAQFHLNNLNFKIVTFDPVGDTSVAKLARSFGKFGILPDKNKMYVLEVTNVNVFCKYESRSMSKSHYWSIMLKISLKL